MALNAYAKGVTGISRVQPDTATAVGRPMHRLAELGHRAVAFVSAPRNLIADPDRLGHFRRLARELGIRPYPLHTPLTIEDVRQGARRLLVRPDPPTAFITNSDYTAHGIYKAARDLVAAGRTARVEWSDTTTCRRRELLRPAAGHPAAGRPGCMGRAS